MVVEYCPKPEEGYFPPDFKEYMYRELKWSRLGIYSMPDNSVYSCPFKKYKNYWNGKKWVFWSRQDDYPDCPRTPLYYENFVSSIPDAGPSLQVRKKIRRALHKIVACPCLDDSLVQFWAPTKTQEGRTLLTTQDQPFALGGVFQEENRERLCKYRMGMCREYNNFFYADAESREEQLGLPGRVFLNQFPEFISNVDYHSLGEYPQRDLARRCQISKSWALPVLVFECSSQTCVGVLEITSLFSLGYSSHVFDIFQEFGLQCLGGCKDSEIFYQYVEEKDEDENKPLEGNEEGENENKALKVPFKELKMVLDSVHKIHKLLLAMTWVPCHTCGHFFRVKHLYRKQNSFFDGFFENMHKKCHLRKEQVTGRIHPFPTLLYCSDVKQFSIAEYPLVSSVRKLGFSGHFTMCLQNKWTGSELYVLEFFLPAINKEDENILTRLSLIVRTVQENFKTFELACSQELGGGLPVEVIDFSNGQRSHSVQMIEASRFFPTLEPLEDGGGMLPLGQPDQPSMDAVNSRMNVISEPLQNGKVGTQLGSSDQPSMDPANNGENVVTAKRNILGVTSSEEGKKKTRKREQSKTGVKIEVSLEDILKCSKMSRDNAARKLGVSISTLKRVCRDYRIRRWPPRNIKKVHSSRPLPVENQEQAPQLNSDLPSNEASIGVVPIMPPFQDAALVTIRAKYENIMIKFRLPLSSRFIELEQEVAKRLTLEIGSFYVKYKDEEDYLITILCDKDLQDCVCNPRSVGNTSIMVQVEPK